MKVPVSVILFFAGPVIAGTGSAFVQAFASPASAFTFTMIVTALWFFMVVLPQRKRELDREKLTKRNKGD